MLTKEMEEIKMAEITNVSIFKYAKKGNLLAFANVELDSELVLKGIKVVKGSKGKFISMPATYSPSEDEWYDVFFPITAEFREELQDAILEAYEDAPDKEEKKGKGKSKKKGSSKKRRDEHEEEDE